MAQRIEHFNILAFELDPKPGHFVELLFNEGIVTRIDVRIPSGHAGRTGLTVFYAGFQIIPFKQGTFLHGNKGTYRFDLEDFPTGSGWVAQVFNSDVHPHTFRCTVFLDELTALLEEPLPQLVLVPPAGGTLV